eukprot:246892_1
MARNPLSLYSLEVGGAGQFAAYTYDHIQHLILDIYNVNGVTVANRNWNNTVHEITFDMSSQLGSFTLFQQSFDDNKCTILGGQMTVDNITNLNIHPHIYGVTNHESFYKFILRSFNHVEQLTIADTQATHVDLSGIDARDIRIFKHLKKVHVHRSG